MSTEAEELHQLAREVRQRLEALSRAGLDRLRMPESVAPVVLSARAPAVERVAEAAPVRPAAVPKPEPKPTPRPAPDRPVSPQGLFAGELPGESLAVEDRVARLAELAREVEVCTRCPILVANRTRTVFGSGSPTARLMFIGEGPGAEEDKQGLPFVGKSGQLLTDMIVKGMGLSREEVYIANTVKCRPPENRAPLPDELRCCRPFLERQIEIVRPEFICLLGKSAVVAVLESALPMGRLRGKWHRYLGIPTIATWHPSYLLRQPEAKKETWADLQILMQAMGIRPPARGKPASSEGPAT